MHDVVLPMINKFPLQRNEQTTTLCMGLHSHQIQFSKVLYYGSPNWGFLKVQEEQDRESGDCTERYVEVCEMVSDK